MINKTFNSIVLLTLIMFSSFVRSATGTLTSDSPCTLAQGITTCEVTMTVQKQNTPISCIWLTQPTLGLVSCFAANNWTKVWTNTNVNGHTMQLKAHNNYPTSDSDWPKSAQSIFNAAPLLDEEIVIANNTPPQQLFMGQPVQGIQPGQQDIDESAYSVNSPGKILTLTGNTWKAISYPYNVTADTVLQFEFKSTGQEPEINGIGFTNSLNATPANNRGWQIHGTQNWAEGITHANYTGIGWTTYTINIGEVFTGNVNYMVFVGDEDSPVNQNVKYRNPELKEVVNNIAKGGSVMAWYDHLWTPSQDPGDVKIILPFGIIKNYHKSGVRNIVKLQLQAMYLEGQRRIGVNFYHGRNDRYDDPTYFNYGTNINSRAKTNSLGEVYYIEPLYLNNLSLYLADIKSQGFVEVMFNTHSEGCNKSSIWISQYLNCKKDIDYTFNGPLLRTGVYDPSDPEPRWQQTPLWKENVQVIKALRNTLEASGVNYLMDLLNEGMPVDVMETVHTCQSSNILQCLSHYPIEHSYLQERTEAMLRVGWNSFVQSFGKEKTVGYSIIAPNLWHAQHRSASMDNIYGSNFPNYLNLHMYVTNSNNAISVLQYFQNISGLPIIIGETFYNDADVAEIFRQAQIQTGADIKYLLQWPKAQVDNIGIEGYKHLPPLSFTEYQSKGF